MRNNFDRPGILQFISVKNLTRKEQLLFGCILLFFISLYFKLTVVSVLATAAIVIVSFTIDSLQAKYQMLKRRPYIPVMVLFYLFMVVSLLFSDNISSGLRHLELRLPLLLFPVSLGVLTLSRNFTDKVLLSFALLTTVLFVGCLANSSFQYLQHHRSDIFFNDNLTLIFRQQSIYFALLVNISIYILGYFLFFRNTTFKGLLLISILFLFGISFLLASRINMATLVLVTLGFCFYYIFSRKKILEGMALIFGLLIGIFLINKFLPQTFNRYKELAYTSFDYRNTGQESHFNVKATADQWNGANFRLAAWNCGLELFRENPVLGVGIGDKDETLRGKYREKNFAFALKTDKNVHSNYIDVLYSLGIIGFLLLLAGWVILPLWQAYITSNGLAALIIITFALAWITEVYFSRSLGNMLAGFFIPFVLGASKPLATNFKKEHLEPDPEEVIQHS